MFLGNGLASVALAFAVLDVTGSLAAVGLVVGARSVANVALLLLGGVIADRVSRSLVLRGGCAAAAASQVLLALALLTGFATLPLLFAAMFLAGVAVEQFSVAWEVSVQENIPAGKLSRVYSYDALGSFVAMPVGRVAVTLLAASVGPGRSIVLLACLTLTAILAALCAPSVRALRRR